jgi:hypothetical protein
MVLSSFSPSLFSLPRLGNGVGGAAAVLLVCVEAQASSSSSSSSRVLQQGEEDGERLRKNDNGVGSAGGSGEGEWQWFAEGKKTMATNGCSSPVLKQTPPYFQILYVFPPSLFLFVFFFKSFSFPQFFSTLQFFLKSLFPSLFSNVPLFSLFKTFPPAILLFPYFYRQSGERFTIPCPSAGYGGVGWLLCSRCRAWPSFSFIVVAGYGGYG